ncbi:MAG: Unknown protein [uncultured Sulfurovum sp.]|uniref:Uncharacterized protein n=1 Tax=uncultured Sulfurovum sp. TaxID=269237 RepID=A0A6S6T0T0_9BACT|nr:MAG: Unknown protein [uncultured Sulfurovum sp.]
MGYSKELYLKNANKQENAYIIEDERLDDTKVISINIKKDRTKLDGGNKKEYYYGKR